MWQAITVTSSEDFAFPTAAITTLMQQILRRLVMCTIIITVLIAIIGGLISGSKGLWSALLAGGLGIIFTGTTIVLLRWMVGRHPQLMAAVVLGGWLLKMVVLLAAVLLLRGQDFYDKYVFGAGIIVIALVSLALEVHAILTAQIPRVHPNSAENE